MTLVPVTDIVKMMNDTLRGWGNYFRYGNCFRQLKKVRTFCEQRLRLHLCYRHKIRHTVSGTSMAQRLANIRRVVLERKGHQCRFFEPLATRCMNVHYANQQNRRKLI